jgi:4-hydroxy-tetrahydrodipicolinate reductase
MNIVLAGYGKMGKMIDEIITREKQHRVVLRVDSTNKNELHQLKNYVADVVIDFSNPAVILDNIKAYIEQNIPAVIGTTGWYEHINTVKQLTEQHQASVLWGSNFSIGVNVFFRINQFAATLLSKYPEYKVHITETHHKNKLDKPSGTALVISQIIQKELKQNSIDIQSVRDEDSVGTHEVLYQSDIDHIHLLHHANNRKGFAVGSLRAASWIIQHKGFHNFADIFEQL